MKNSPPSQDGFGHNIEPHSFEEWKKRRRSPIPWHPARDDLPTIIAAPTPRSHHSISSPSLTPLRNRVHADQLSLKLRSSSGLSLHTNKAALRQYTDYNSDGSPPLTELGPGLRRSEMLKSSDKRGDRMGSRFSPADAQTTPAHPQPVPTTQLEKHESHRTMRSSIHTSMNIPSPEQHGSMSSKPRRTGSKRGFLRHFRRQLRHVVSAGSAQPEAATGAGAPLGRDTKRISIGPGIAAAADRWLRVAAYAQAGLGWAQERP